MIFENLSDRLQGIFKKLRGHGKLTEDDVNEAMREVRSSRPTSISRSSRIS